MNTTTAFNEQRRVAERRVMPGRRYLADRRRESGGIHLAKEGVKKYDQALDLLGCILAVAISVVVLLVTGLLEGVQSTSVQIMLIAAVVYAFVVTFRRAFYS